MSALDRPTADELRRGEIAAAVKNGRMTPQEAEAELRAVSAPKVDAFGIHSAVVRLHELKRVLVSLGGA